MKEIQGDSRQRTDSVHYTDPQYTCSHLINTQLKIRNKTQVKWLTHEVSSTNLQSQGLTVMTLLLLSLCFQSPDPLTVKWSRTLGSLPPHILSLPFVRGNI